MKTTDVAQVLLSSLNTGLAIVITFIPKFIAGLIIFLLGIIVAAIIKRIIKELFAVLHVEAVLQKYHVPEAGSDLTWTNIFSEIIRWFVIILFLIPTADIWEMPRIVTILNAFLFYLPNVFVAAIISVIGLVFSRLAYDVIISSSKGLPKNTARTIALTARWAIIIFILLAVLNQLGVASDLIKILFTGLVAMVAIAGGIAFGLGGQDTAKDILRDLRKKLRQ